MRIRTFLTGAAALIATVSCSNVKEVSSPADYVNPFIGASTNMEAAGAYHGLGKTFPGATTPWGLVQVNPTTITGGDNAPGYSYEHKTIEGFAMTQMSGTGWFGDLGNFLVMPTTGKLQTAAGLESGEVEGWRSEYDKAQEKAEAGYYTTVLNRYGIKAEASATQHCGILRFTFPEDTLSRIQVDLARRTGGSSSEQYVERVGSNAVRGWMKCTPEGGGWGNGDGNARYTVFFYAETDKPLDRFGVWSVDMPDTAARKNTDVDRPYYIRRQAGAAVEYGVDSAKGPDIGFFTEFPTKANEAVVMKVGISFVDMAGAENNFKQEIASKSFDEVRSEAKALWNKELSKVKIEGGTDDEKTIFYTALYHTMIDPRVYSDCDGRYIGGDLGIHKEDGSFHKRTIFSGWDVFRSQFPLQSIINPSMVSDMINSMITMAEQSGRGYLPRWEILNSYSGCMLGNPALPVIANAYAAGIRTFDAEKALKYCIGTSEHTGNGDAGYAPGGLGISMTLEYAYGDWCISTLADSLGHKDIASEYQRKAQAYRNIFDPEKGWFRPKDENGEWIPWPENGRLEEWYGCIECNAYQQGWFVPHDIEGMAELMGGRDKALADLEDMFEKTPEDMLWNEYYNHANEPVHFIPYLFNRLGRPDLTQKWSRFICDHAYENKVEGLKGNEDIGQMSAWYVLSASGIHPVCPGDGLMEITSPVFDKITFSLDGNYAKGKEFTVIAHNNSASNRFIGKMKLNGKEWTNTSIPLSEITKGGILELFMTEGK